MRLGIAGLPNVGKSTLFNSLTKAGAAAANYPFCTIEPNVGIVTVPDNRLLELTKMYNSENTVFAVIEFVDIAGLVRGASKGEGLGNKFLSHIREVDAIIHVVRCFDDGNIVHVEGAVNPVSDIETINIELIFSDLETLERRISKTIKTAKTDKLAAGELELLQQIKAHLEGGNMVRSMDFNESEKLFAESLNLLTNKPVIYAANVSESELVGNAYSNAVIEFAQKDNSKAFIICAKLEEEIASLDDDEKSVFLSELGLKESGLDTIISESYSLLGLISFLTAGPKETRAWTIKSGSKAPEAAGKIHTDFEKGFIRAETVKYGDLMRAGSYSTAKDSGLVRLEGKDYIVQDGDVILFRFNV